MNSTVIMKNNPKHLGKETEEGLQQVVNSLKEEIQNRIILNAEIEVIVNLFRKLKLKTSFRMIWST